MEKHVSSYIQMNTSTYLLKACDEIACKIRRKARFSGEGNPEYIFTEQYTDIVSSAEYIGLNLVYMNQLAAVLEGTLRTLICEIMETDAGKMGELSILKENDDDYMAICRAYKIARKYKEDVEFKGGWDNLKVQYREVLGRDINKVLDKDKTEGLNSIFTLRNVAAHGTAIVTPKVNLNDASEGEYPFKWQRKLQNLSIYVKKEFDLELFDSLQHPSMSYHFTGIVKEFITEFRGKGQLPLNSQALFNNLEKYEFGYQNNFEFPGVRTY